MGLYLSDLQPSIFCSQELLFIRGDESVRTPLYGTGNVAAVENLCRVRAKLYFQWWDGKMKSMVTIEDFNRLDIRIGKVLSVEKVSGADKLLKFIFDLGEEKRQIIAGMAEFYSEPSILEGKEMPLLLNIEPKTFRGQVSQGMIIAADVDGRPVLLHPEKEISPGSIVR